MLELLNVRRSFGSVEAVRDVTFAIQTGATFGLLGPNGAGKTTTMRMILGILVPDAGSVRWDGAPIDAKLRRRFGYLPEERGLYGKMKVRDQIVYFGRLHGLRDPDVTKRTNAWMERLGIAEYAERPCSELSKGNQQKVQVACAAVHEPEFLILDEPFSGLDPVNAEILFSTLRELQKAGATLVLSSHQMWQLENLCTDFCIIANGVVRAKGTLEELRGAWETRVIVVEPAEAALEAVLAAEPGAQRRSGTNGALAFELPRNTNLSSLARRLVAAGDITRFERLERSLQEIYLRAIGEAA
ncbi:MAG: ABC transporter ATP-binding protein [Candidatus Velthaea sp.]